MTCPALTRRKRKRDNGVDMPRLREVVDQETGEVYHVETTKQAKRRHQRSGPQPKATVGQINAADIWNKQEEKIKKDREREEKRKKAKLRQEEKDARLRELQLEKLKAGRISIEDTWGKVNASQNRLHKFFGPPKSLDQSDTLLSDINCGVSEDDQPNQKQQDVLDSDLDEIFPNSPLSPRAVRKSDSLSERQARALTQNDRLFPTGSDQNRLKRAFPSASQAMMPPPTRPLASGDVIANVQLHAEPEKGSIKDQQSPILPSSFSGDRPTLSKMTVSQINIQANETPHPTHRIEFPKENCFIGTQDVQNVLSGLCSQDFADDFAEDGEADNKSLSRSDHILQCETDNGISDGADNETTVEEFDDEGIDDESLLSLAATQRLRRDVCTPSKRRRESELTAECSVSAVRQSTPVHHPADQIPPSSMGLKSGDSFAMENLDDEDLIQGLENYEQKVTQLDDENASFGTRCHGPGDRRGSRSSKRPGRVLPWVKNPISFPENDQNGHDLTATSPLSPWEDE